MKILLGLLRIAIGSIFLWAFFDKLLGLGYATSPEKSWLAGGSPTFGYLKNATHGPFVDFFQGIAGNPIVDSLFMFGLFGIGLAFVLGIAMRFASWMGALLMLLMYSSAFPPANNPVLDEHIIYALVLLVLAESKAGEILGFGKTWKKSELAQRSSLLA